MSAPCVRDAQGMTQAAALFAAARGSGAKPRGQGWSKPRPASTQAVSNPARQARPFQKVGALGE